MSSSDDSVVLLVPSCHVMTVAELAKRFERDASAAPALARGDAHAGGRVKALARRLEEAASDDGIPRTGFGGKKDGLKQRSPPPKEKPESDGALQPSAPVKPSTVFLSPSPLPPVSRTDSKDRATEPVVLPSPRLPKVAKVRAAEQLPSVSNLTDENVNGKVSHLTNDSPKQLSVSERRAAYEKLTSSSQSSLELPKPQLSSPVPQIPQPPSSIPQIPQPPELPSPPVSPDISASAPPYEPIDPIPDVSDGDLDDIEDMERVEDDGSISSTAEDDENATFRRAKTVQTLPSEASDSSSHRSVPIHPPTNPSTPSNASENSSFASADFAPASEEFHSSRPTPRTLAVPRRPASRHASNLSAQPHTLHIAPGSFKNLPKAKVLIARKRGPDEEKVEVGVLSEEASTRKLIREYDENPKEVIAGSVSLLHLSEEEEETVEFRDPEVSDVRRETSMIQKKKDRVEAFRHRYDECMDPQEIEQANEVEMVQPQEGNASKERYQRRRLFRRGKQEKARQREERLARQREAVARRSTVISGALDRVSLAADPWIDFITDTNTLPVGGKAGGGIRRGLKRLFRFGRQPNNAGLIKTGK